MDKREVDSAKAGGGIIDGIPNISGGINKIQHETTSTEATASSQGAENIDFNSSQISSRDRVNYFNKVKGGEDYKKQIQAHFAEKVAHNTAERKAQEQKDKETARIQAAQKNKQIKTEKKNQRKTIRTQKYQNRKTKIKAFFTNKKVIFAIVALVVIASGFTCGIIFINLNKNEDIIAKETEDNFDEDIQKIRTTMMLPESNDLEEEYDAFNEYLELYKDDKEKLSQLYVMRSRKVYDYVKLKNLQSVAIYTSYILQDADNAIEMDGNKDVYCWGAKVYGELSADKNKKDSYEYQCNLEIPLSEEEKKIYEEHKDDIVNGEG